MKHMKKILLLGVVFGAFLTGQSVFAAEKAKDEGWDIPNIALGNGLTDNEKQTTVDILTKDLNKVDVLKGINTSRHNEFIVDGNDLVKYVTDVPEFTESSKAYSSAFITRTKTGSGVMVDIVTPENITARTEAMYRSAAITSGVYDAYIRIASVKPMDGSGALAGIYKIYDEVTPASDDTEQKSRDEKREVAQDQMQVVSNIDSQNQSNADYSSENVLVMLADIQLELQKMNDTLSDMSEAQKKEKVTQVVDQAIQANGLESAFTPELKNEVIVNMTQFTNTDAIKDVRMTEQLTGFKDDLVKNGSEFKDNLLNGDHVEKAKGFWGKIKSFFSSLFN